MDRRITNDLPGAEILRDGLADLARGIESVPALLVSIAAPRLRDLGIDVPNAWPAPEHRLYEILSQEEPRGAHSRYNAWIRRLVSLEHALEFRRKEMR